MKKSVKKEEKEKEKANNRCTETLYIFRTAAANEELQEKQLKTSKTNQKRSKIRKKKNFFSKIRKETHSLQKGY